MRSLVNSTGPHSEAPVGLADMTRGNAEKDAAYPMYQEMVPGFPFNGGSQDFSRLAELGRVDQDARTESGTNHRDAVAWMFFGGVGRGIRDLIDRIMN